MRRKIEEREEGRGKKKKFKLKNLANEKFLLSVGKFDDLRRVSRESGVSSRHIRVDALAATTIPQCQHLFHSSPFPSPSATSYSLYFSPSPPFPLPSAYLFLFSFLTDVSHSQRIPHHSTKKDSHFQRFTFDFSRGKTRSNSFALNRRFHRSAENKIFLESNSIRLTRYE